MLRWAPVPRIGLKPKPTSGVAKNVPNDPLVILPVSYANIEWFRTLNTSYLNFAENRSPSLKVLNKLTSSCAIPG